MLLVDLASFLRLLLLHTLCVKSLEATIYISLVPRPLPPKERPGTHCLHMRVISLKYYAHAQTVCTRLLLRGGGVGTRLL